MVEPEAIDNVSQLTGAIVVTGVLVAIAVVWPDRRHLGALGAVVWFVLSVRATRRGDNDGLWALIVPFYLAGAAAMIAIVAGVRTCVIRTGSNRSPSPASLRQRGRGRRR